MNNQEPFFDPEDPRLTAYALGELTDPGERAAVEQTLQASPEARETLREIRELTAALSAEYEQERRLADAGPGQPEVVPAAVPSNVVAMVPGPRAGRTWSRRLLLAAAGLLLTASVTRLMVVGGVGKREPVATQATASSPVVSVKESPPGQTAESSNVNQSGAPALASVATHDDSKAQTSTPMPSSPAVVTQNPPAEPLSTLAKKGKSEPAFEGRIDYGAPVIAAAAPPAPPMFFDASSAAQSTGRASVSSQTRLTSRTTMAVPSAATPLGAVGGNLAASTAGNVDGMSLKDAAKPMAKADFATTRRPALETNDRQPSEAEAPGRMADTLRSKVAKAKLRTSGFDTATYDRLVENSFLTAKENPLSTFSIDVDTASYANVRRFIESGSLPPPDAVRIEELINYFPYTYTPPAPGDERPFAVHLEAAPCPWNPQDRLVRIGIKGRELAQDKRPPSNLVFLLDVSGSMRPQERLPLIKASMRMLVEHLTENDCVAIVTYAGDSGVALRPTTGEHKEQILRALEELHAGGSTNGASGIKLAYQVAREGFIKGGTNRVILATDGDFNVGVTNQGDLVRLIETEAKSGVFLSALGVGTDNYKDATMQKLADKGNGNYAYIDRLDEARKVLVEQMSGTLVTIAKDVKIQVEFNPATVSAYRLIGYEKRMLRKEDFNDDRIDAGEIGAGHSVTALYEVVPAGQAVPQGVPVVDALKYGNAPAPVASPATEQTPVTKREVEGTTAPRELLTVKMRHKAPDGDKSERSYEESLADPGATGEFAKASPDFKFAAAVAGFGMVLRDSPYKGEATLGSVIALAQEGKGDDPGGYRGGFIELARHAQKLRTGQEE